MARQPKKREPDAIGMLRADHDNVKELFEKFRSSRSEKKKTELAQTICMELTVHTMLEEEIFYPAVREAIRSDDLLDEAVVEHASAKTMIAEIQQMQPGDELYDAKVNVLGEYVNHHIREEQNEMFPKVRKAGLDLKELAEEMRERKEEIMDELEGGAERASPQRANERRRRPGEEAA